MTCKRKRLQSDITSRAAISKRSRHTTEPDLLSPLSDELLIRILTFLPLPDLLNTSPVSRRFYHLSGDYQLWKRLYYSHFVLPRALRIPGFRDGSAREGKLHYSSRKAVWADGRKGGWADMHVGDSDDSSRDWKKQYKLRHNWSKGKCAVEELQLRQELSLHETSLSHKVLVNITEGIAITADATTGLRAWDLKTKQLLAQIGLGEVDSGAAPSCIAIDDQKIHQHILEIAIGFIDGGFGVWALDVEERRILLRYRHKKSSNGELVGVAFSYPYLLTATKSVLISMYTFDGPNKTDCASTLESTREVNSYVRNFENKPGQDSGRIEQDPKIVTLQAPYLLTSLKSHTSRAPLTLSIRKTTGSIIASIVYTFSTLQGWCLGIQDLHLRPPISRSKHTSDIITTRLAYTLPVWNSSSHFPSTLTSPARHTGLQSSHQENGAIYGPINLCYTHPYLLATLPDNTLILYLCTSNATSLSISPGIRLWGHTSGISDAEITARGKAVSVSSRGEEIRVWELEGRAHGKSIEIRPATRPTANDKEGTDDPAIIDTTAVQWDGRRNWVGFDDEMVIVLKESRGRESLMVYDFT
ncbi:hypothetical protein F4813DRAFT_356198 [Daldinia decipiens]|uniref:uncharacterized protein n=1 Tax=Daldinia decipiens TaxID=326647 RepID=UPI0020C3894D|nr:uncharacterized protein F4813DRAFT_356198 [Daldinia decipiens]KAI1658761.1 hypothetical protein F4813DRAFT_356198 [Daldinia decipiens]